MITTHVYSVDSIRKLYHLFATLVVIVSNSYDIILSPLSASSLSFIILFKLTKIMYGSIVNKIHND